MNVVVVAAAGSGKRMKSHTAKAFLSLAGEPLLVHSLRAMDRTPQVDAVIVVAPPSMLAHARRLIRSFSIMKAVKVIAGGSERQDSVFAGLKAARALFKKFSQPSAPDPPHLLLVHDAARALVEPRDIARVIRAASRSGAAILAIEPRDTLKQIAGNRIVGTIDRGAIRQAQTPQGFHFDLLYRAHLEARRQGILATDEAGLVERLGVKVAAVKGSESNIKITRQPDLVIAEALLERKSARKAPRGAEERAGRSKEPVS